MPPVITERLEAIDTVELGERFMDVNKLLQSVQAKHTEIESKYFDNIQQANETIKYDRNSPLKSPRKGSPTKTKRSTKKTNIQYDMWLNPESKDSYKIEGKYLSDF